MIKFEQQKGTNATPEPPFIVAGWRGNRHFQTIWPNRIKREPTSAQLSSWSKSAIIKSEDGDSLRVRWSQHHDDPSNHDSRTSSDSGHHNAARTTTQHNPRPVLIVLHGLAGSADADNVIATAAKGYALGFDIVRVDLRNAQANDTPSLGVGHAGRSEDLRATIRHIEEQVPGAPITVIAFSMGGNITLKALGEYGQMPPKDLRAAATISVPIDLGRACTAIDERRENWIYRRYFLKRLKNRYLNARQQRPDLFHAIDVKNIQGIRDWDNAVVAPLGGFTDAENYYTINSSLKVLGNIQVPTLLVQAQDDPFIPFESFQTPAVLGNNFVYLLAPRQGGHVGFYTTMKLDGEPDRYWAENRALAFCAKSVDLCWNNGSGSLPAVAPTVN
ncbi:MAG: alpha/beta fold hydrolase [Acidobacteriota bacterium]|nr:alpha/beta fold hydrolase [Acidobacteriota bacterium]